LIFGIFRTFASLDFFAVLLVRPNGRVCLISKLKKRIANLTGGTADPRAVDSVPSVARKLIDKSRKLPLRDDLNLQQAKL